MSDEALLIHKDENICKLVMNRPEIMNALNRELLGELIKAFEKVGSEEDTRVVILEGSGGNFSSGADYGVFQEEMSAPQWLEGMKYFGRLIRGIREIPQPVIAKVRGVAVGGGSNLALAADFVLASHDARFSEIFVHIGAVLDGGGTYFLPRLVGLAKARELALLGDFFDGKTAASMGLIYKSTTDKELDGEVEVLAKSLAAKPPKAVALIKEGLEGSLDMTLAQVLEWEASHQPIMLQTEAHKNAVRAFLKMKGKI